MVKKTKDPADYVFDGRAMHGCYLMEDGSVGYIQDADFDIEEFIEDDDDWEEYDETGETPKSLYLNGREPIGNICIDMYIGMDDFLQGDCFLYYNGETMRDWCQRNGEYCPVEELPYEVWEALENDDTEAMGRFCKKYPGLMKNFGETTSDGEKPTEKAAKKRSKKTSPVSDVPILHPYYEPIRPLSYYEQGLKVCPNCGDDIFTYRDDVDVKICRTCGCAYSTRNEKIYPEYWDHEKFNKYREENEKDRKWWFEKSKDYKMWDGTAWSPENFDRLRYGGLFNFENPKDRSRILNFSLKRKNGKNKRK